MYRPSMYRGIPVFIASPGDVAEERGYLQEVIAEMATRLKKLFRVDLHLVEWRSFAPVTEEAPPQTRILRNIEPNSIFVGILYRRYGTQIPSLGDVSGTAAEFQYALENKQRLKILTYFRKVSGDSREAATQEERIQLGQVEQLKQELDRADVFHQSYGSPEEFRRRVVFDLLEVVLEMIATPEAERRRHFTEFFRLGVSYKRPGGRPSVLLVYPPISKPSSGRPAFDWRQHLLPTVVYEDFKTIQKVESALRLTGILDYATVTTSYEPRAHGNRIWICLPRNEPAQRQLRRLGKRTRFEFVSERGERYLRWRLKAGRSVKIRSPLAKYLQATNRPDGPQEWDPDFGYTYARDYGVLARFEDKTRGLAAPGWPFYHYFIGGIRGLGTWGVGWFIDRYTDRLAHLSKNSGSGDIQILLEVTYHNHRIVDVTEVSDRSESFFRRRYSDRYVQDTFKKEH